VSSPAVTIVTPSYNQGVFIRATIESVLGQDFPDLEYIVMDGGSTDETASIVAEYRSRLTWISEKDRGQSHAINKGFMLAKAPIVAWLNSDDTLLPGAISRAVEAFREAPTVGAIYGEGYLMDREGRITGRFPATERFNLWKLVHLSDYVLQQSTFFRRVAVEQIGWVDESLHYAMDWDLLIRLGQRFGLHYVPEYLGVLREYGEAKTSSGGKRRVEEIRRVLERHTGQKYAPGYWTYGLDTVQRQWKDTVNAHAPRSLAPAAYALGEVPITFAIGYISSHCQGYYADGWASDRFKWMLPEGSGNVVVRGTLPDFPRLRGTVLTAVSDGRELGRWPLQPGDFEVRFRAPQPSGGFSFELRSSRALGPFTSGEKSLRRLAFLFRSAEWES
jgi:glycosyltransferase involved in cell wall biosynthesis